MNLTFVAILTLGWCAMDVAPFNPSGRTAPLRGMIVKRDTVAGGGDEEIDLDVEVFKSRRQQIDQDQREFDGYAFRDLIFEKWGECYDVDFNRVDSFGFRQIYLNVYPFKMGGRGKWRHESELDYLMHLQAITEILERYGQLDNVIHQIQETNKKPKMGAPLVAVPIRLDLTTDQINKIMG